MKLTSGLKNTPSRLNILSILKKTKKPLDASEIYKLVKNKTDLATVYRTLETFVKKGLINKLEFGEGKYRYEAKKGDHHHLICTCCDKIDDIKDKFIEAWGGKIKAEKGFLVKSHALEFFGLCKCCQKLCDCCDPKCKCCRKKCKCPQEICKCCRK